MTSQQNVLELAKQGNPKAIATLINHSLKPKGITVTKASLKDGCFNLMIEFEQICDQVSIVKIIQKFITSLDLKSINLINIYGKQVGKESIKWHQIISLDELVLPDKNIINSQLIKQRTKSKESRQTLPKENLNQSFKQRQYTGKKMSELWKKVQPWKSCLENYWRKNNTNKAVVLVSGLLAGVVLLQVIPSWMRDSNYKSTLSKTFNDSDSFSADEKRVLQVIFDKDGGFEGSKTRVLQVCKDVKEGKYSWEDKLSEDTDKMIEENQRLSESLGNPEALTKALSLELEKAAERETPDEEISYKAGVVVTHGKVKLLTDRMIFSETLNGTDIYCPSIVPKETRVELK